MALLKLYTAILVMKHTLAFGSQKGMKMAFLRKQESRTLTLWIPVYTGMTN